MPSAGLGSAARRSTTTLDDGWFALMPRFKIPLPTPVLVGIAAIEAFVAISDTMAAVRCNQSATSDCWPFFFSFVVNLPASILATLAVQAFAHFPAFGAPGTGVAVFSGVIYFLFGTAWWVGLASLAVLGIRRLRK